MKKATNTKIGKIKEEMIEKMWNNYFKYIQYTLHLKILFIYFKRHSVIDFS